MGRCGLRFPRATGAPWLKTASIHPLLEGPPGREDGSSETEPGKAGMGAWTWLGGRGVVRGSGAHRYTGSAQQSPANNSTPQEGRASQAALPPLAVPLTNASCPDREIRNMAHQRSLCKWPVAHWHTAADQSLGHRQNLDKRCEDQHLY